MKNVQVVILAAGKGTRMNKGKPSPIPKALYPLGGKPMVSHILETLKNIETEEQRNKRTEEQRNIKIGKPILVIGYKAEMVKKTLGKNFDYVIQKQRLGTAHAAKLGIDFIRVSPRSTSALVSDVLILQADDSAFYKPETLKKFITNHQKNKATLSFLTTEVANPQEMGRIVRDKNNKVLAIIEKEDLTPAQEKIKEINCGGYLLDLDWAEKNICKIKKTLKGGKEYPLPDIVKVALAQKKKTIAYKIPRSEWYGINSPLELEEGERLIVGSSI